jgi:hypothetical protein
VADRPGVTEPYTDRSGSGRARTTLGTGVKPIEGKEREDYRKLEHRWFIFADGTQFIYHELRGEDLIDAYLTGHLQQEHLTSLQKSELAEHQQELRDRRLQMIPATSRMCCFLPPASDRSHFDLRDRMGKQNRRANKRQLDSRFLSAKASMAALPPPEEKDVEEPADEPEEEKGEQDSLTVRLRRGAGTGFSIVSIAGALLAPFRSQSPSSSSSAPAQPAAPSSAMPLSIGPSSGPCPAASITPEVNWPQAGLRRDGLGRVPLPINSLEWGHDSHREVIYRKLKGGPTGQTLVTLEGIPANQFTICDRLSLAHYYSLHSAEILRRQPLCFVCGSPQMIVQCHEDGHECHGVALCHEHYTKLLYGNQAHSGMSFHTQSLRENLCSLLPQKAANVGLTGPIDIRRYSVRPLIIITVNCFADKEFSKDHVHSQVDTLFKDNNLIQGFGVLHFWVRGLSAQRFEEDTGKLASTLSLLRSSSPAWSSTPVLLFFNIHFDGINTFQWANGDLCEPNKVGACVRDLSAAIGPTHPHKFIINTCGLGRESIASISRLYQVDIASYEQVLPTERVYAAYAVALKCEIFNLMDVKQGRPLSPFHRFFATSFSPAELMLLRPIYAEVVDGVPCTGAMVEQLTGAQSLTALHVAAAAPSVPAPTSQGHTRTVRFGADLLARVDLASTHNRARYVRARDHLLAADLLTDGVKARTEAESTRVLLRRVNASRAARALPPLSSLYEVGSEASRKRKRDTDEEDDEETE